MSISSTSGHEAPREFSLGMANGDIPQEPAGFTEALARSWRSRGLTSLAVAFAVPAEALDVDVMRRIGGLLSDHGMHVSEFAGVNANLVHPDSAVRRDAVARVKAAVKPASALGATYINSGPGSCSPTWREFFYRADRANFTPEAEDRAVDTLSGIAEVIDDSELSYTIECHQLTTMRSAEVIRRVLDRVDHPRILANFDPVNLLDSAYAAYTNAACIPAMVETVGPRYANTCHLKDIVVTDGLPIETHEVPPGRGLVAVDTVLQAAAALPGRRPVDLIVEHLDPGDAETAVERVRRLVTESGFVLL